MKEDGRNAVDRASERR